VTSYFLTLIDREAIAGRREMAKTVQGLYWKGRRRVRAYSNRQNRAKEVWYDASRN
jgi:hypothetical protein